jgi:predicted pyridoxine 5'-phosphate oxidase superfamily flavin-nucleotide-binding protein
MKRVVAEQKLGFVATVNADGTPNLSPKGTMQVLDDDHIIFADIRSPGTMANLARHPALEINFVDPFSRKGYRFKGTARVVTRQMPDFAELLARYPASMLSDRLRCRRQGTGLAQAVSSLFRVDPAQGLKRSH